MSKERENFESALKKLESIVNDLMNGKDDLDSTLNKFKEGAILIKTCKNELAHAENEFKKIKADLEESEEENQANSV